MLKHIGTVITFVSDVRRAKAFYGDALGFRVKREAADWVELETGGTTLALHGGAQPRHAAVGENGSAARGPHVGISFEVASVRSEHEALLEKGVRFTRAPAPVAPGMWVANFVDPDGNALGISGPE